MVEKVYKEILQLFILEQIITGSIFLMNIRSKKKVLQFDTIAGSDKVSAQLYGNVREFMDAGKEVN